MIMKTFPDNIDNPTKTISIMTGAMLERVPQVAISSLRMKLHGF